MLLLNINQNSRRDATGIYLEYINLPQDILCYPWGKQRKQNSFIIFALSKVYGAPFDDPKASEKTGINVRLSIVAMMESVTLRG